MAQLRQTILSTGCYQPWPSMERDPPPATGDDSSEPMPTAQGNFCTLCQECDHSSLQCTLAQVQQSSGRSSVGAYRPPGQLSSRICAAWNNRVCIFPATCNYRHIRLNCRLLSHPARDYHLPHRSRAGNLPVRISAAATTQSLSS